MGRGRSREEEERWGGGDAMLLALKIEEGAMPRTWVATRSWKQSNGIDSVLEPLERNDSC